MGNRVFLKPKMQCPTCGITLYAQYDLYVHKTGEKGGLDVYDIDLLDEAEGLAFTCADCEETYFISNASNSCETIDKIEEDTDDQ